MMEKQGTILVVDDNKAILTAVELLLRNIFSKVITLSNPERIKELLFKEKINVILLDMNFNAGINSGNEGLFWLQEIKKIDPSINVVLFTAYADIELAVKGIKLGATDFIVKPWDNHRLCDTLQKAAEMSLTSCKNNRKTKKESVGGENGMFWGTGKKMQELRLLIEKVAVTDANILITGENGTGKEMLAKEIHNLSERRLRDLVCVDMGALTETLFESELFGHIKGAFTDARTDRVGKFESANQGTLFLDEIGNLPYHLQAKLLTALQRRSIVRVGSNENIDVNIRLICATNKDLKSMVNKGEFREDLLYRINTIHIEIPPLRERIEDIIPLSEMFLSKYSKLYGKENLKFSDDLKSKLASQPWLGNIRELQHSIEKAVIIASDKQLLDSDDFDFTSSPQMLKEEKPLEITTLEEMEYALIKESLLQNSGNLSLVASQLGISRQTLYNKLKRYGL